MHHPNLEYYFFWQCLVLVFFSFEMHLLPSNAKSSLFFHLISLSFILMPSLVLLVAPKDMETHPPAKLSIRQLVSQPFRQSKQPCGMSVGIMRQSASNLFLSSVCHFDLICLHDHFRIAIPHHHHCTHNIPKYNLNMVPTRVPKIYVW